jgi:hypothetical protein
MPYPSVKASALVHSLQALNKYLCLLKKLFSLAVATVIVVLMLVGLPLSPSVFSLLGITCLPKF